MINRYFETSMRVYLPAFLVLYVLTFYLSTAYIADEEWIAFVLDENIEDSQKFNNFFFAFVGFKVLVSWLIKSAFISFACFLVAGIAFSAFFRIALLSLISYVLANLYSCFHKLIFVPESIRELRSNPPSLWSTGLLDDQSTFLQNLSWHTSPFELMYLLLFCFGAAFMLRKHDSKASVTLTMSTIITIDIFYIILTALW